MTPTQKPADRSAELHGALLQLLLNTSGDDFEPERVLVDSLQLLSHACRPIKSELGQPAPDPGQRDAPELVELEGAGHFDTHFGLADADSAWHTALREALRP